MNLFVKQINICLIHLTLINYFSTLVLTESHVSRLYEKFNLTNTTNTNKGAVLRFNRLAKSNNLHNPCSPGRHQSPEHRKQFIQDDITYTELTGTPGNKLALGLLRELITKSTFLQGLATNVIRMNLIEECTELRLPNVANVPNPDELHNKKLIESMRSLYTSLTNQTAHMYLIWDKQQSYISHNCTVHKPLNVPLSLQNPKNHSKVLAQHYWTIAVNLRDLMCIFNEVSIAFNIDLKIVEATDRVLKHTVSDSAICSRKAVLDCQIMKSSITLLENISDFLRDQTVQLVTSMNTKS